MDKISINSKNNETNESHKLNLRLSDKPVWEDQVNILDSQIRVTVWHDSIYKTHRPTVNLKLQQRYGINNLKYKKLNT